jgi:PAS domain S-box-containing protein
MAQDNFGGWKKISFPPWLPVAASVVLMVMVAFVAARNAKHLNSATQWRRHSAYVILAELSFQNNLLDIQRGLRGYVTLGDTNALASFYNNSKTEHQHFQELLLLTGDNPTQQQRLKNLEIAVTALLEFDRQAIIIYRQQGFAGISRLDATGKSRAFFGSAQDILSQFSADEQRLWDVRDASEENQYGNAGWLLAGGSTLAAVLLLFATYLAAHELSFRRKAEAKLENTLLLQNANLNAADYGIVATDHEGIVQTFNPAAERLLGYSAEEIIGKATPLLWRDALEIAERATNLSKKLGVPVRPTFEAVTKKVETDGVDEGEWTFIRKDGSRFTSLLVVTPMGDKKAGFSGFLGVFRDIGERKKSELEREKLIAELKRTLVQVKTLSGLIPICAWCKNVRSDTGYWQTVEQYVRVHSDVSFSHGVCPNCAAKFKDEILRANQKSHAADALTLSKA